MKKIFLFSIYIVCCYFISTGQRPPLNTSVGQHAAKDTSGKENKPGAVSPAHTTVRQPVNTNSVFTTAATPLTDNNSIALQDLIKKMAELEAQVTALKNKLPFQDMAVITVETSDVNIQNVSSPRMHQIKIDNPVSNNNPSAVVVAMKQSGDGQMQLANAFYNQQDRYWYISTPSIELLKVENLVVSTADNSTTLYTSDQTYGQAQGLATARSIQPIPGQKFSVIIFKKLP